MKKLWTASLTSLFLTGCGDANLNEIFVSQAHKESVDQVLTEAKYAYDKGNFDKVISLSNKVTAMYPYHEKALVLKSNAFLAKADFDVLGIVEAIVDTTSTNTAKLAGTGNTDPASSLLGKLASAFPLSPDDVDSLTTKKETVKNIPLYIPADSPTARLTTNINTRMYNLSQAVTTLCPLLGNLYPESNEDYSELPIYKKGPDGILKDERYSDCGLATEEATMAGRSKFTWALANIAEAVAFYSVVMYSSNDSGIPNIQLASQNLKATGTTSEFLSDLSALTNAVDSIFPTTNADDSMLNAVFDDLGTSSVALGSIAGMPSSVSEQILSSTDTLKTKIKEITGAKDTADTTASQQNEALRNTFTKASAEQLNTKIAQITNPTDKATACELFKKLNSDKTVKPAGCP